MRQRATDTFQSCARILLNRARPLPSLFAHELTGDWRNRDKPCIIIVLHIRDETLEIC